MPQPTYIQICPVSHDTKTMGFELQPQGHLRSLELPQALHYAIFLAFAGMKWGTLTVDEALGDYSLPHALAHFISGVPHWQHGTDETDMTLEQLADFCDWFEQKVLADMQECGFPDNII